MNNLIIIIPCQLPDSKQYDLTTSSHENLKTLVTQETTKQMCMSTYSEGH